MVCIVPGEQYGSDKQFCFCVVIVQCRINAVMLAINFYSSSPYENVRHTVESKTF